MSFIPPNITSLVSHLYDSDVDPDEDFGMHVSDVDPDDDFAKFIREIASGKCSYQLLVLFNLYLLLLVLLFCC